MKGIAKLLDVCIDEICDALHAEDIKTAQKLLTIFKSITGEEDLVYWLLEDFYNRRVAEINNKEES